MSLWLFTKTFLQQSKKIKPDDIGGVGSLEIKIVGSIADKDEVHILKNITEVFLIEQRIRSLHDKLE